MIGRFSGLSSFLLPKTPRFQWIIEKTCKMTVMTLQLRGQLRVFTEFPNSHAGIPMLLQR